MKNLLLGLSLLTILALSSCNQLEQKVQGGWTIETIEANFTIITNGFHLKKDHTCDLPMTDTSDRHTSKEIGVWEVFKKGTKGFLKITSDNKLFEGVYEVSNYHRWVNPENGGALLKVTFSNDKVTLNCAKHDF